MDPIIQADMIKLAGTILFLYQSIASGFRRKNNSGLRNQNLKV